MIGWAVATWFSAFSLAVAVTALALTLMTRVSSSKAKLIADVQWRASDRQGYVEGVDYGGFGDFLKITVLNNGPHQARNVSIEVVGTSPDLPHNFINMVHDATIDATDRRDCGMQLSANWTPPPVLLLTWTDGRKGVQRYERTLQLTDGFDLSVNPDVERERLEAERAERARMAEYREREQARLDRDYEEKQTAHVRGVVHDPQSFLVINDGPHIAYDVVVDPTGEHICGIDHPDQEIVLRKDESRHMDLHMMKNTTRPMTFRVSWRDGRGPQRIDVEE